MQCIAKFQSALQQVEALTEGLLSESGRAAFNEKKHYSQKNCHVLAI